MFDDEAMIQQLYLRWEEKVGKLGDWERALR